jgi:cellulose synthase/poly-beta-1,6-N-acetylglucosamine synthase-like glycosyltransferase
MEIIAGVFLFSYVLIILLLSWSWLRIPVKKGKRALTSELISVIVPVRNETDNILNLMNDLWAQKLDPARFEVIIVDDNSQDDTPEKVKGFINGHNPHFKLLEIQNGKHQVTPKKRALTKGVENSKGEIIVTTDGDCRVSPDWLDIIDQEFKDEQIEFIAGPVAFTGVSGLFGNLQRLEFSSLIGIGASSIQLGYPNICNGANLAFRKNSFTKLNGYSGNGHLASGDDEFLLQKFATRSPKGIRFLKNEKAIVYTSPKRTLLEFYHQRKRWTSKLKHHKEWHIKFLSGWIFVVNFVLIASFIGSIVGYFNWFILVGLLGFKFLCESIYLLVILKFFKSKMKWLEFGLLQIIHPFYIVLFGLVSNYGTFNWKGRTYHE